MILNLNNLYLIANQAKSNKLNKLYTAHHSIIFLAAVSHFLVMSMRMQILTVEIC